MAITFLERWKALSVKSSKSVPISNSILSFVRVRSTAIPLVWGDPLLGLVKNSGLGENFDSASWTYLGL